MPSISGQTQQRRSDASVSVAPITASSAGVVSKKPRGAPVQRTCSAIHGQTRRRVKAVAVLVTVSCALVLLVRALPVEDLSVALTQWIRANESAGFAVFLLLYWLLLPLCIPSSMIDAIGGSVFGVGYGVILNTVGKTGGTLLAFALGKRIGRERIGSYLATNFPAFTVVAAILEGQSWKPLLLVQLSALPHGIKSYGLAITDVSTYRFVVSSFVTALPFTVLVTQIGSQTQEMLAHASSASVPESASADATKSTLLVVGLIVTGVTMVFFVVYTKKEIDRHVAKVGALDRRDASVTVVVRADDASATQDSSSSSSNPEDDHSDMHDMSERLLPATSSSSSSSSSSTGDTVVTHRVSITT